MADELYDRKRMLAAAAAQDPNFNPRAARRLGAIAGAAMGLGAFAAGGSQLGCLVEGDDELGAFGGVADIPKGLHDMQAWSGKLAVPGTFPTGTVQQKSLVRVDLPLQYARDWTIQLSTPSPPLPPNPLNVALPSTQSATVRIAWGHHGSNDQVELDWPARGGSLTVHGAYVEVSVTDPGVSAGGGNSALGAQYSAWLSEGSAARQGPYWFQPTRTISFGSKAGGAPPDLRATPPRARAFYLTMNTNVATSGVGFQIYFADNNVVRAIQTIAGSQAAGQSPSLGSLLTQPMVWPPSCNVIGVENISGGAIDDIRAVFLVDVGS